MQQIYHYSVYFIVIIAIIAYLNDEQSIASFSPCLRGEPTPNININSLTEIFKQGRKKLLKTPQVRLSPL